MEVRCVILRKTPCCSNSALRHRSGPARNCFFPLSTTDTVLACDHAHFQTHMCRVSTRTAVASRCHQVHQTVTAIAHDSRSISSTVQTNVDQPSFRVADKTCTKAHGEWGWQQKQSQWCQTGLMSSSTTMMAAIICSGRWLNDPQHLQWFFPTIPFTEVLHR